MVGARDLAAVAIRLLAVLAVAATLPVLRTAWAQYPALDPERGVMTMAPLLDRATPAVVNISVVSGVPTTENPLFSVHRPSSVQTFSQNPSFPCGNPCRFVAVYGNTGSGVCRTCWL